MSLALPADTIIRRHHEHGTITFLKSANLSAFLEQEADFRTLQTEKRYGEMALAFLTRYRQLFKLREPDQEFKIESIVSGGLKLLSEGRAKLVRLLFPVFFLKI
jgi:hypothetical protein